MLHETIFLKKNDARVMAKKVQGKNLFFGNRGQLKVLNDSKLMINDQGGH